MSNLFRFLYSNDNKSRAELCKALIAAGHNPSETFGKWTLINQAIEREDEHMINILEKTKIDPKGFYNTGVVSKYEEKEIAALYKILGGEYYRNLKLSPISYFVYNNGAKEIYTIMKNGGKNVRNLIIEDICSLIAEGVEFDIFKDICDNDYHLGSKYNILQNIVAKSCTMGPEFYKKCVETSWLCENLVPEEVKDERGYNLLMIACEHNHTELIEILLHRVWPFSKDCTKNCAFYIACGKTSVRIVYSLINNFKELGGYFPQQILNKGLEIALENEQGEIASYLISEYHCYTDDVVLNYDSDEYKTFKKIIEKGAYFVVNYEEVGKIVVHKYKPGEK